MGGTSPTSHAIGFKEASKFRALSFPEPFPSPQSLPPLVSLFPTAAKQTGHCLHEGPRGPHSTQRLSDTQRKHSEQTPLSSHRFRAQPRAASETRHTGATQCGCDVQTVPGERQGLLPFGQVLQQCPGSRTDSLQGRAGQSCLIFLQLTLPVGFPRRFLCWDGRQKYSSPCPRVACLVRDPAPSPTGVTPFPPSPSLAHLPAKLLSSAPHKQASAPFTGTPLFAKVSC